MDAFLAIEWLFKSGWAFLTAFNIPGTNFTPLQAAFFSSFCVVVIKLIRSIVGSLNPSQGVNSLKSISGPPPKK